MECRLGCAACCIVISISSSIPGMLNGKPAGVRCIQLSAQNTCKLFGSSERPAVCNHLKPSIDMCGFNDVEAFQILSDLEQVTTP